MRVACILAVLAGLSLPAVALGDAVVLKDGTRVEGKLLSVTEKAVKLRSGGAVKSFDRAKVKEIYKGDVKIEKPCPLCRAGGVVTCVACGGDKKAPGCCLFCKGEGYRECLKCLGKKKFKCEVCKGTGKRIIMVPSRGVSGWKKKAVNCKRCKGYGWYYCGQCKRKGYERCKTCRGSTLGPCGACKRSGRVLCPLCRGAGQVLGSPPFLSLSYGDIKKVLADKRKPAEQKKAFVDGLVGKAVFWPAVLVRKEDKDGVTQALVNLDAKNTRKVKTDHGWEKTLRAGDLRATIRSSHGGTLALLEEQSAFWIRGVLFAKAKTRLVILKAEIFTPEPVEEEGED